MDVIVSKPGTKVRLKDGRLILGRDKEVYNTYPLNHVDTLICITGVYVTEPVMNFITGNDGAVLFIHKTGKLKYMAQSLRSILSVKVRMKQYHLNDNVRSKLLLSKILVYAKIQNAQRFLTEKYDHQSSVKLTKLRSLRDRSRHAGSLEELIGVEGLAAKEYFSKFRSLMPSFISFTRRQKRKKCDIVNSCLDFIYSLLYYTSFTALTATGLDPYLGFYHSTAYGHAALSSDIMEPFRAQIGDRVVLKVLKDPRFKEIFYKNNFTHNLDYNMIGLLMKHYTKRIHSIQTVNGGGKSNFELILRDARNLRLFCLDPSQTYRPWIRA